MSLRVKEKEVKESYEVVTVGYCDMQYLLMYETRHLYTANRDGWKSDIYFMDSVGYNGTVISTGYQPIQEHRVDYELLEKNEKKACEIYLSNRKYESKVKAVRKLLLECVKNALNDND